MGSWWKILPVSDKRADSDPGMALAGTARSTLSICISLWTTPKRKWNVTWIWNEWSRVSMYCIWPAMIGIWLILTIFILILLLQMETRVKWLVPQVFKPTTLYQVGYSIHWAKRFEFPISCWLIPVMNFSNYPFWQCYKPSYMSPAKLSYQPLSITSSIAIVIRFRSFSEELIINLVHQMVIVCCSDNCIIKGTSTLNAKALLIMGFKRVETNCNLAHRYPPGPSCSNDG